MIRLLLASCGVSLVSALVPLVNIELYLGVLATQLEGRHLWLIALVASLGQSAGKVIWYFAARRSLDSAWVRRRIAKPKFVAAEAKWQQRAQGRPAFMGALNFAAASLGVPPLLVMAVVAGSVRMNFAIFFATTFVGRALRFWVVLAGVDLIWV